MRYVRFIGRLVLVAAAIGVVFLVQGVVVVGVIAAGGAPALAVWVSFAVVAAVCAGMAWATAARLRRRADESVPPPSRAWPRAALFGVALFVTTSLLALTTFLRLDAAPMRSPETDAHPAAPTIDIRRSGAPASSTNPLVVVHGGPGVPLSASEESAIERVGRDRTVVVYDQAGVGRSGGLHDPHGYTLRHAVDELAGVVAATGADQVDLFGYSWGASVATAFAVEHPELVGRMAFISPGVIPWRGSAGEPVGPQARLEPIELASTYLLALSPRNLFVYALTAVDPDATRWFASDGELDARAHELYETTVAGLHCDASQIDPPPRHVGFFALQVPQLHPDLNGITRADAAAADIPILVLRGECDYIPDHVALEYVEVFGATLVRISGSGHALLEDRPERVLEELAEFLG